MFSMALTIFKATSPKPKRFSMSRSGLVLARSSGVSAIGGPDSMSFRTSETFLPVVAGALRRRFCSAAARLARPPNFLSDTNASKASSDRPARMLSSAASRVGNVPDSLPSLVTVKPLRAIGLEPTAFDFKGAVRLSISLYRASIRLPRRSSLAAWRAFFCL